MSVQQSSMDIAYCLRYAFTCWLDQDIPFQLLQVALLQTQKALEKSKLRVLRTRYCNEQLQMVLSCRPGHSAFEIARHTKSQIAFDLKQHDIRTAIKRKFILRRVGENTSKDLEQYLQRQVERRDYVDDRFSASLTPYTKSFRTDHSMCFSTTHGRYWNDIHLVVSTQDSFCVVHSRVWDELCELAKSWLEDSSNLLSSISLLPDHLHLLIRLDVNSTPYEVGSGLITQLNSLRSMPNIYRPKFYVGTYGAYSMTAVRNKGAK